MRHPPSDKQHKLSLPLFSIIKEYPSRKMAATKISVLARHPEATWQATRASSLSDAKLLV